MIEIKEVKSRLLQDCDYFREHVWDDHVFFYGGPLLCDNSNCPNYVNAKMKVEGEGESIGACATHGFETKERAELYFENEKLGLISRIVKGVVNKKVIDEVF